MKTYILIFILIASVGIFPGCRAKQSNEGGGFEGGGCEYEPYSGVMTIKEVVFDPRADFDREYIIHYDFQADSPDAPPRNSPDLKTQLSKKQVLKAGVEPGKKFRVKIRFKVGGTCAPGPFVDDVETWQTVP